MSLILVFPGSAEADTRRGGN